MRGERMDLKKRIDVGMHVIYGKNGLCHVTGIQEITFPYVDKKQYYILRPISDANSQLYVPCDSEELTAKMRCIMSKEKIDEVLCSARGESMLWIEDKNERHESFQSILSSANRRDLLLLIGCLYQKKKEKQNSGKRLCATDDAMLYTAIKMIEEEFSFSLGISCEDVGSYIRDQL